MKILYIQYAGDFAEAYDRLITHNGSENYYGQSYTVNTVINQARNGHEVLVLVLQSDGYNRKLEHNLQAIGLARNTIANIVAVIEEFSPDAVILRTPHYKILRYLRKNHIRTLPVFADSFEVPKIYRLRSYISRLLLRNELVSPAISWVANHQINASKSLNNLGIPPEKILPYDWVHEQSPSDWSRKTVENIETKKIKLFFAGALTDHKGVFDLIESLKHIKQGERAVYLEIAGKGDLEKAQAFASGLGVDKDIAFLGLIDHKQVLEKMHHADLVIVPSRHSYPEGLPMTIMESLMVGTPVIASNHPMFVGRVGNNGSVIFFKQMDARNLSEKILECCKDSMKYQMMADNTESEWSALGLELKWGFLVDNWLFDSDFDFSKYSLAHIQR